MSVDTNTYLGPYFRCETESVNLKKEIRTCLNPICKMYEVQTWEMSIRYCNQCAHEINNREIDYVAKNVDHYKLRDELNHRFTFPAGDSYSEWMAQNNIHIWFPNVGEIGNTLEINSEIYLIPIAADKIRVDTNKFLDFFQHEVALLKSKYGDKKVKYHWGLINYFS